MMKTIIMSAAIAFIGIVGTAQAQPVCPQGYYLDQYGQCVVNESPPVYIAPQIDLGIGIGGDHGRGDDRRDEHRGGDEHHDVGHGDEHHR